VGVDHRHFSPRVANEGWREKLNLPQGNPVVGVVGRLSPVKGHRHFIESAELVLKRFPLAAFLICGEDAQITSTDLKRIVEQKGIGKSFRFVGRVRDIRDIIALLDVGVVSSVGSETICRVALEYMSMGKPVVGTNVNAIPEVVHHDVNGLVVEPGYAGRMADALIRLLEDESQRLNCGRNSRSLVLEEFTLDRFAQKTEDVYLSLLN
jgi:glycosyltransferase involved in cell wall biosynthesis